MSDDRLNPDRVHPLNAADCRRSVGRIAEIETGLTSTIDEWFWRERATRRRDALEQDASIFGLMPNEEAELEQLKSMLNRTNQRLTGDD